MTLARRIVDWLVDLGRKLTPMVQEIKRPVEEINGHDACPTYLYRGY